jgi:hypothetical protein
MDASLGSLGSAKRTGWKIVKKTIQNDELVTMARSQASGQTDGNCPGSEMTAVVKPLKELRAGN